jgi:hypothetical protein
MGKPLSIPLDVAEQNGSDEEKAFCRMFKKFVQQGRSR